MTETDDQPEARPAAPEPRQRMERTLAQIRQEGWKAALIYAVVDGVAVFLLVNFLIAVLDPSWVPASLPLPPAVVTALPSAWTLTSLPGSALLGAMAGLGWFNFELLVRIRRPLVEQFEAANPQIAERLRTARDAVAKGAETRMALRLYDDVLDRLRETSSLALVDLRRIGATVAVIVLVSGVTMQVAVFDVTLGEQPTAEQGNTTVNATDDVEFDGLRDGNAVLGDSEAVSEGDEDMTAQVESTGGDRELQERDQFPSAGGAGGTDRGGIDSQQSGFAQPDEIEDAALIREYNTRIRQHQEEE